MTMRFADKLYEARIIPLATRNQVKKMEGSRLIQAKAIVGNVRTILMRGVIPEKQMRKLICVLRKFDCFKNISDELQQIFEGDNHLAII